jgi:FixJ family two-component response regulator
MPIKVLVVEPDASLLADFVELLEIAGFGVVEARSFQEGRTALREASPELLVTELRLEGFNGLQLIITNPTPIPSIVIGNADPVLQADAQRFGAAFLLKPFSHADLLIAVERQLAAAAEAAAAAMTRRWNRKPVKSELRARIDDVPARVLDVSYGGLRVEVDRASENPLPPTFSLTLPEADVDFPADLVWSSRTGDSSWQCGVALARLGQREASTWRSLVDMVP